MFCFGIPASLAFWMALARDALPAGSPPPSRAATWIARASFVNSAPRRASVTAFLCLICAHLEWPAMGLSLGRSLSQKVPDIGRHRVRLVLELAPGDPNYEPSGDGQPPVAGAVAFEIAGSAVDGAAVELGHQLGLWPCAVHLIGDVPDGDVLVGQREWDSGRLEEGKQEILDVLLARAKAPPEVGQ